MHPDVCLFISSTIYDSRLVSDPSTFNQAQSGSVVVQLELAHPKESVLVMMDRIANQKHHQSNPAAPIFGKLRAIVLKSFGLADGLHAVLTPFWPQVEVAFAYGSQASGSEHAGSDVDLIVIELLPPNELLPAKAPLGRAVNPTLYTANACAMRNPSSCACWSSLKSLSKETSMTFHESAAPAKLARIGKLKAEPADARKDDLDITQGFVEDMIESAAEGKTPEINRRRRC